MLIYASLQTSSTLLHCPRSRPRRRSSNTKQCISQGPNNAFLKAKDLNLPAACPGEELHQFLIIVYGEYILPASMYFYTQVLLAPGLYSSPDRA